MSKIKCPICDSDSIKVALKLESPLGGFGISVNTKNVVSIYLSHTFT